MRIGLNLIHAQPEVGGAWNYLINLIEALGEMDDLNTYFVFVTPKSKHIVPQKNNFEKVVIEINPIFRGWRILYENVILPFYAKKLNLDCIHWFANVLPIYCRISCVVTIYDLLVFKKPESFGFIKKKYMKIMMKSTGKKAKILLPISCATSKDIKIILRPKTKSVFVIPGIVDEQFKPLKLKEIEEFKERYRLPEKYFLYVAHTYPHKNHIRLLKSYLKFRSKFSKCWPLVLRGDNSVGGNSLEGNELVINEIKQLGLQNDVIRLGRIKYSEMPALYSGAGAVIFPSLFEGFGMPIIEAMACGCPVAASNLPVLRELGGPSIRYFNAKSIESIADAMNELYHDKCLREKLKHDGMKMVKKFRKERIIGRILLAYRQASES